MDAGLKKFLQSWAINTLAVLVAVYIVPGIHFKDESILTPFVTSLVLGILNAFFRPILMFFALPLLIVTLGLFSVIINAVLLYFVGLLLGSHFEVESFWSALLGSIIISIVSVILNSLTGTGTARVSVQKGSSRDRRRGGDDGPVIDV
jgi:putative membrane protein